MRMMHISYEEANATPLNIVMRHMEYSDIENQMKAQKQNAQSQ